MKRLLAAVLLLALAVPAWGATYYAAPAAAGDSTGSSAENAFRITTANSTVAEGDVVYLASGTYLQNIAPGAAGGSLGSISYIGNISSPSGAVFPGITLNKDSVTVKGVKSNSSVTVAAAYDSLAYCQAVGTLNATLAAAHSAVDGCLFTSASGARMNIEGDPDEDTYDDEDADLLENFRLNNSRFIITHTTDVSAPAFRIAAVDTLFATGCRWDITIGSGGNHGMFKAYNMRNSGFTDCRFDFYSDYPMTADSGDERNMTYFRDWFRRNRFVRDTMYWRGIGERDFIPAGQGANGNSVHDNCYESCEFRSSAPCNSDHLLYWQDWCSADTLIDCVLVARQSAPLAINNAKDSVYIKSNTMVRLDGAGHVLLFDSGAAQNWDSTVVLKDNIFYCVPLADGQTPQRTLAIGDAAPALFSAGRWSGDYNLFYCPNDSTGVFYVDGVKRSLGSLCSSYHTDPHSLFYPPFLAGWLGQSSYTAITYDVAPLAGSAALGTGSGGGDIGAKALEHSFGWYVGHPGLPRDPRGGQIPLGLFGESGEDSLTIYCTGDDTLHVSSIKVYHVTANNDTCLVTATISDDSPDVAPDESAVITISDVSIVSPLEPDYVVVIESDDPVAPVVKLDWRYCDCPAE